MSTAQLAGLGYSELPSSATGIQLLEKQRAISQYMHEQETGIMSWNFGSMYCKVIHL